MDASGVQETAVGILSFFATSDAGQTAPPGSTAMTTALTPSLGADLLTLTGFLLTLLATFALALLHAARPWRNISVFLNGAAIACGCGLIAAQLGLLPLAGEDLTLLRGLTGACSIAAVLLIWPSLRGVIVQGQDTHLPLRTTQGRSLSLEDALDGSDALVFAHSAGPQDAKLTERWSVPRTARPPLPVLERIASTVQDALRKQGRVSEQFQTIDDSGAPRWYELAVTSGRFEDGRPGAIGCMFDVTRFRKVEAEQRHMLQESTHRAKNLLAIIQSVARLSAKTLGLPASAVEPFNARLQAIALCYDLLVREDWEGVPLTEVLRSQLTYTLGNDTSRASWNGPVLRLRPAAVQTLAIAFHELAARALTQGALATPSGQLHIFWEEVPLRDGSPGIHLVWQENGHGLGKPVFEGRLFARDILERLTPRGLRGEVSSSLTEEGFRWEVRFPASNMQPPRRE